MVYVVNVGYSEVPYVMALSCGTHTSSQEVSVAPAVQVTVAWSEETVLTASWVGVGQAANVVNILGAVGELAAL